MTVSDLVARLSGEQWLANYAGGIVVMKHGTRPVTYAELLHAVQENES